MQEQQFHSISFAGFGLMAGSIARAYRLKYPDCRMTALTHDGRITESERQALADGVLNQVTADCAVLAASELVLLCAPVAVNRQLLSALAEENSRPLISDIGSVKGDICETARSCGDRVRFIGGHPMAGSEKTGYAHSTAGLLENAYYIFTPLSEQKSPEAEGDLARLFAFARDLGAVPVLLTPRQHDEATAAVSHLPHLAAVGLVNTVREADPASGIMKQLAAGGFRDITRIASSSPAMWEAISLSNRSCILEVLDAYIAKLQDMRRMVQEEDGMGIYHAFETSGEYRNSLPPRGGITAESSFELFADLKDESGAIARLAGVLAAAGISLKNIGILHSREFADGVLHMDFYDRRSQDAAVGELEAHGYHIYRRN